MSVATLMPAATQDTKEVIAEVPVLTDYHMNGGYDWQEEIEEEGWAVIPNWGVDGWDLGEWPYVMIAGIRTSCVSSSLCRPLKRSEVGHVGMVLSHFGSGVPGAGRWMVESMDRRRVPGC